MGVGVVGKTWWLVFYPRWDFCSQTGDKNIGGGRREIVNSPSLPIRPKGARRVLRELPLKSRGEYTFVDFGSGKGRMLLIAAQCGFRRMCGLELRKELHDQACRNFRQCHNVETCSFESLNMDAADYECPNEKLVLFFFNPFASEVMAKVLRKLIASLDRCFPDVWVVLHDPSCAYLADRTPQLRLQ